MFRTRTVVICYHAVSDTWPASLAVSPAALERQLTLLLQRGWVPTTFTQAVLAPPAPRTLAITFDDAYLSVYERALPVLSALKVPATVFAPTSFMDRRSTLTWPEIDRWRVPPHAAELTSMDWNDLGALVEHGWEIGSHTCSHPHLTRLDDAALREELAGSRQVCSERLGEPTRSLAYPFGDVDRRVVRCAAECGYAAAAILGAGRAHPHLFPRIGVYPADSERRFRLKLSLAGRSMARAKALL